MRLLATLFVLFFVGAASAEPGVCPDGRININEAPAAVLVRLKGVGDKKAEAIVADRGTNGPFATADAIARVKGIGPKSVEKWAAQITTDCNAAAPAAQAPASAGGEAPAGKLPGPIDLNAATAEQLAAVPGIGPKTAEAIVALRGTKGGFKSVDELTEVKGIGPAKLLKIRDALFVNAQ
ncbi:MAG: ComEA family DNA-binding protein [bacterium]